MLTAVSLGAGFLYSRQAILRLSHLEIEVEDKNVKAKIERALVQSLGRNLASISFSQIEETLAAVPEVASVSMRRRWPSTLVVKVVVREPVALVFVNGALWRVDKQTKLMGQMEQPLALPLLKGVKIDGNQVTPKSLGPFLQEYLSREDRGRRLHEVQWSEDRGLTLIFHGEGVEADLGWDNFLTAWNQIDQVWPFLRGRDIDFYHLDASMSGRVIARLPKRLQNSESQLDLNELVQRREDPEGAVR